ncbi:MAG: hypothetical protein U9N33_11860 [Campylobacterota bacterium]|nr:hypothetical protein [Campylobacterota bacterium]
MKNKLNKIIVSALFVASSLVAQSTDASFYNSGYSLVAIEGGYSSLDVEKSGVAIPTTIQKYDMYSGGLKIGAQGENYRLFLSARYYGADDFDYAATYGVEAQYLFNFSQLANFYIGVNGGIISMRYLPDSYGAVTRTLNDPYIGGDLGFNIHLGESVDLELGTRFLSLSASNSQTDRPTYVFDNMITAYASVIFKFKMD